MILGSMHSREIKSESQEPKTCNNISIELLPKGNRKAYLELFNALFETANHRLPICCLASKRETVSSSRNQIDRVINRIRIIKIVERC